MVDGITPNDIGSIDRADLARRLENAMSTVVEPLLPASSYPDTTKLGDMFASMGSLAARERYIADYGYVLLTTECLADLVTLLAGKKVIDVGSGTGFLVHVLRSAGIDATALDQPTLGTDKHGYLFRQIWALDIADDFSNHLPGDYDAVILSWPDMGTPFAFDVASAMRPGQILIYQGEPHGACTADDDFFEYLDGPEWTRLRTESRALNVHHRRFATGKDSWQIYRKTEPTEKSPYTEIEDMLADMRPMWEHIMVDCRGTSETSGSCLHAAIVLSTLLGMFARASVQVCGGGPEENAGLKDLEGVLRGHYWVEGKTAQGVPFIADMTADQFGYPPVVVIGIDEGRRLYIPGNQEEIARHVEEEMRAIEQQSPKKST